MAQLVARAVRDCEVACSSQVAPTIITRAFWARFLYNLTMIKKSTYDRNFKIAIALNLAIIFFEIIGFMLAFSYNGWSALIFYTQDSNVLALLASILFICFSMWKMLGHKSKFEPYVHLIKYAAVTSVTLTFIVVITILSWTTKYTLWQLLTMHSMLYHHTICPLLCIISFVFFEKHNLKKQHAWTALSFTFLYAIVTIFLNLIGELVGPYPFLMVYSQPWWMSVIWCVVILGSAYIIARLLRFCNKKMHR